MVASGHGHSDSLHVWTPHLAVDFALVSLPGTIIGLRITLIGSAVAFIG